MMRISTKNLQPNHLASAFPKPSACRKRAIDNRIACRKAHGRLALAVSIAVMQRHE